MNLHNLPPQRLIIKAFWAIGLYLPKYFSFFFFGGGWNDQVAFCLPTDDISQERLLQLLLFSKGSAWKGQNVQSSIVKSNKRACDDKLSAGNYQSFESLHSRILGFVKLSSIAKENKLHICIQDPMSNVFL